nr:MAG: hypothetical protein DIU70_00715 [Bacillota bacterium]
MKRAPAIIGLTLICALLSLGFAHAGRVGWQLLLAYPGTAGTPAPPAPATGAPAPTLSPGPQVVAILVDGLSAPDAVRLPTLMHLARTGAFYSLTGPAPAWPAPRWATVLTGRSPAAHGILLAAEFSPPSGENFPGAVAASGRRVAAAGSEAFLRMVEPWVNAGQFPIPAGSQEPADPATAAGTPDPETAAVEAAGQALATGADLVLIHLSASGSMPREEFLARTDSLLARILGRVSPGRTTLAIIGTYGAAGEDGPGDPAQPTPLVLAGPLAAPGRDQGDLRDVAPTLAGLFGLDLSAEGRPLSLALVPGTDPGTAGETGTGAGDAAAPLAAALQEAWQEYWAAARPQARRVLAPALLGLGYLLLTLRQPPGRVLAAATLLRFLITWGTLVALGLGLRPDLPALASPDGSLLRRIGIGVVAGMVPGAILVGLWAGHRGRRPAQAALLGLHLTLLGQTLIFLSQCPVVLYTGWTAPVRWPGYSHAIRFFLDAAHGAILGLAAPAWAAVAAGTAALAAGESPPREPSRGHRPPEGTGRPTRPRTTGTAGRATGSRRSPRRAGPRR